MGSGCSRQMTAGTSFRKEVAITKLHTGDVYPMQGKCKQVRREGACSCGRDIMDRIAPIDVAMRPLLMSTGRSRGIRRRREKNSMMPSNLF